MLMSIPVIGTSYCPSTKIVFRCNLHILYIVLSLIWRCDMFVYWVIGLGVISSLILNWSFKKFLNIKPTFTDTMILTLFLLGVGYLFEVLFKYQSDPFVALMTIITSLILAFRRYKEIKKIIVQS